MQWTKHFNPANPQFKMVDAQFSVIMITTRTTSVVGWTSLVAAKNQAPFIDGQAAQLRRPSEFNPHLNHFFCVWSQKIKFIIFKFNNWTKFSNNKFKFWILAQFFAFSKCQFYFFSKTRKWSKPTYAVWKSFWWISIETCVFFFQKNKSVVFTAILALLTL